MDLVFTADNDGMMLCINIPILDDLLCEGSEDINLLLSSSDENARITSSRGTVTILDDDGMYETRDLLLVYVTCLTIAKFFFTLDSIISPNQLLR